MLWQIPQPPSSYCWAVKPASKAGGSVCSYPVSEPSSLPGLERRFCVCTHQQFLVQLLAQSQSWPMLCSVRLYSLLHFRYLCPCHSFNTTIWPKCQNSLKSLWNNSTVCHLPNLPVQTKSHSWISQPDSGTLQQLHREPLSFFYWFSHGCFRCSYNSFAKNLTPILADNRNPLALWELLLPILTHFCILTWGVTCAL